MLFSGRNTWNHKTRANYLYYEYMEVCRYVKTNDNYKLGILETKIIMYRFLVLGMLNCLQIESLVT